MPLVLQALMLKDSVTQRDQHLLCMTRVWMPCQLYALCLASRLPSLLYCLR